MNVIKMRFQLKMLPNKKACLSNLPVGAVIQSSYVVESAASDWLEEILGRSAQEIPCRDRRKKLKILHKTEQMIYCIVKVMVLT